MRRVRKTVTDGGLSQYQEATVGEEDLEYEEEAAPYEEEPVQYEDEEEL